MRNETGNEEGWERKGNARQGLIRSGSTHLLDAVEKGVANVPAVAVADGEAPGQRGLVEVDEQAEGQVPEQQVLMVEGGDRGAEEGGAARDEEGKVGEARQGGDERRVGVGGVDDVEGDLGGPEGLGDGGHGGAGLGMFFLNEACNCHFGPGKKGETELDEMR